MKVTIDCTTYQGTAVEICNAILAEPMKATDPRRELDQLKAYVKNLLFVLHDAGTDFPIGDHERFISTEEEQCRQELIDNYTTRNESIEEGIPLKSMTIEE